MHHHAPIPAAKPHLSLNAFSPPSLRCEERDGSGEKPSLPCALANGVRSGLRELPQAVKGESDFGPVGVCRLVSRLLHGHCFGAYPAPCGSASFCFGFATLSGSRFLPEQVCKRAANAPHKLLPGPAKKALLGTWEPGPLCLLVTRARSGNSTQTEITIMYQNKVTLIGFTGNDAEVRTNDNRSFTTLSLATKSSYKKDGKYVSHTEWHRCVVFGKLSEFAGTLKKGAHLQVEGELRSREYETKKVGKKPAQKKTIWEIRVNSILKLDRAENASPEEQDADSQLPLEAAA